MRTQNQIQSKINELTVQRRALESRQAPLAADDPQNVTLSAQISRLEDMIIMLEWVLNEPTGKYHA
ncbi:hypothetical protein C2I18_24325 [Paenibacillus sp. PK3_47]|uniref:hypothetical protein n=1 Tax=Paenibacillus sp. PK3_47 TaxID=2072642 RepID=UPI00201DF190|nr:hypothetical protein [Paenibacillus sp. PK3_47]UQZ36378.1 hypothetical protein C2I18_24325 [Paenibacillus sp. PK3_47]